MTPNNIELRDWFAGMALQSVINRKSPLVRQSDGLEIDTPQKCAEYAYVQADVMLAARKPAVEEPEWTQWHGGKCPVGDGIIGDIEYRDSEIVKSTNLDSYDWKHHGINSDIIAYRIGGGK